MDSPPQYIIYKALNIATRPEAAENGSSFSIAAIIFKGKRVFSSGYNINGVSVKKLHPQFQRWDGSLHAEVHAIYSAKRSLRGYSIFVIRVNNQGQFRNARPCEYCWRYIKYAGIKNVYYTVHDPVGIAHERVT